MDKLLKAALPGVEGRLARACELMLAFAAPQALARWPLTFLSSFLVVLRQRVTFLPFYGLVPEHIPQPSHAPSLALGQETTLVVERPERQGEL